MVNICLACMYSSSDINQLKNSRDDDHEKDLYIYNAYRKEFLYFIILYQFTKQIKTENEELGKFAVDNHACASAKYGRGISR